MTHKKNIVTVILLLSFLGLYAQKPSDAQRVNVHFSKVSLRTVLDELSHKYALQFSYGNDHLKLQEKISFHSEGKTLEATLDQLFEDNNIVYANIGNQLVLKPARRNTKKRKERKKRKKKREEEREERDKQTLERGTLFDFDIHSEIVGPSNVVEEEEVVVRKIIPTNEIEPLIVQEIGGEAKFEEALNMEPTEHVTQGQFQNMGTQVGQISLMPFLSTSSRSMAKVNVLSLNVLWGINGGVNGFEIGLIGNSIKRNVHGLQVGGIFNAVKGHVFGTQIGGLFNITKGQIGGLQIAGMWNIGGHVYGTQISCLANVGRDLYGMQVSGLSNIATDVYGFQIAGLFNFANGKLFGSQIAGFGNIAWGGKSAVQFAGVFNSSAKAQFQIATAMNIAQEVEGAQIATINVAKRVKGVQFGAINMTRDLRGAQFGIINSAKSAKGFMFGIINVVDSIRGLPIGLINIVKKNGYNRLEVSGGDAMYVNVGAKFGAKRLYHIVHGGWRVSSDNVYSWSLGVGMGTMIPFSERYHLNLELVASHVNEKDFWTGDLNLLNQFKITFDIKLADSRASLFLGPTFNAMVSNLYDEDTKLYGSKIMPYSLFNQTFGGTNINLWIGMTAGLRF